MNPLEEATAFAYDGVGNQTAVVAPGTEVAYFGYDAVDRLSWVRADAFGVDAATYYAYDPTGNRTRIDAAEGHSDSSRAPSACWAVSFARRNAAPNAPGSASSAPGIKYGVPCAGLKRRQAASHLISSRRSVQ